jgi:hypothetical protein
MSYEESFQSQRTPTSEAPIEESYFRLQLCYALYTFSFWIGLYIILSHKYELKRIERLFIRIIHTYIVNTAYFRQLNRLKESLFFTRFNVKRLNDYVKSNLRVVQAILNYMNRVNMSIKRANYNENSPVSMNLGAFLYHNFRHFILIVFRLKQSLASIYHTFSFDVKGALLLPLTIKNGVMRVINEVRLFWRQIEQIIQIVQLPIAFLSMIGKFCLTLRTFVHKLERPNIRRA